MIQYHEALTHVLTHGVEKEDRTGVGTISTFGYQMRFDLQSGFPAVTTKKLAWKSVVSELLWFLEGSGDERRLAEILHDTRDTEKKTIWSANADADYWKDRSKFPGDLGRVYGVQWRHWRTPIQRSYDSFKDAFGNNYRRVGGIQLKEFDQIKELIHNLKKDPNSRRHILTAWNPGELDQMALPPCHIMSQFDVTEGKLSCQMYQRSCDMFLGVPFNIASYSLLTHIIAKECSLEVGEFIWVGGDCHIYKDHVDQVKEQLSRQPKHSPTLEINPDSQFGAYKISDFTLKNYDPDPTISAKMAV